MVANEFALTANNKVFFTSFSVEQPARVPAVILDMQPGGDHFGPEDFHLSLNEVNKHSNYIHPKPYLTKLLNDLLFTLTHSSMLGIMML